MKGKVFISKRTPQTCIVCNSLDVQYWVAFVDRNASPSGNYQSVLSCPNCIEPATAILLRKAGLVK